MEAKAILYHSNRREECEKFIIRTEYLITSRNAQDDKWLGMGMYFWDNESNVRWWHDKQCKGNPKDEFIIVMANVLLEHLLDLTDYDIYISLENIWKEFCKKAHLSSDIGLGNKLNCLFDYFNFGEKYDLIKVYGKYNYMKNNGIFTFDYKTKKSEPTIAVKCIYCIRNEQCILEKEFLKEVEP